MEPIKEPPLSNRLTSLDALRGFVMVWIIGGDTIFKSLAKATNSEFLFMALFYFLVDVLKQQRFAHGLVIIGVNCLAVYIATQLFQFKTIANVFVGGLEGRLGNWFEFLQAAVAFVIVWLILYWMYRKKSFIRI